MSAFSNKIHPTYIYPGAHILLADDMGMNQKIFCKLVEPWQVQVDVVEDGTEAVEAVHKKKYQMIFLDQMMPKMLGVEAAELIHQYCDVPMILMTANLEDGEKTEYQKYGFVDFLAKPVEISSLQSVLETYMPVEYRCPGDTQEQGTDILWGRTVVDRHILETFVHEVKPLAQELPEYAVKDIDLFRIKVHGIRGSSRQLDEMSLSEAAEAMEQAAKRKDQTYIDSHMQELQQKILAVLEQVEVKLSAGALPGELSEEENSSTEDGNLKTNENPSTADESDSVHYNKSELFEQLHAGFDRYRIRQIEESIRALEQEELTSEENEVLEKAKDACEDFEYEAGSALFS